MGLVRCIRVKGQAEAGSCRDDAEPDPPFPLRILTDSSKSGRIKDPGFLDPGISSLFIILYFLNGVI